MILGSTRMGAQLDCALLRPHVLALPFNLERALQTEPTNRPSAPCSPSRRPPVYEKHLEIKVDRFLERRSKSTIAGQMYPQKGLDSLFDRLRSPASTCPCTMSESGVDPQESGVDPQEIDDILL